ncbi:MAG TPA: adenylate/guanylate cyclase domain-containing protein [Thermodesulfobacteriota bacterium]|nr:adenylate/guanylate cyclase domain-containing protein [Thermodesulfobacteriota bacterium]
MSSEQRNRKLAVVFCADAAGYSRLMGMDEGRTLTTLTAHFQVMRSFIGRSRGRVVEVHGDNLLAEFESVVDAVQCAVEIQNELKVRNGELPEASRMLFRIGINLGDVIEEKGSIYGDGVNVAARLERLADAEGVCISGSVHDHVKNKLSVGYRSLGAHSFKNIAEPVRAYGVLPGPDTSGRTVGEVWRRLSRWRKAAVALAVALLTVAGGLAVNKYVYQSGSSPGMLSFLAGKTALPLPDKPSIAVLPFANMTGDPKQEYFADGFTEQLITSLSKISTLFVIARNSSFTYKGKPVKVQQVSEELGVRYVLEGSVQKFGDRVRINAQLIDAVSGEHLWAEHFDRDLKEIFGLQDEVILKIASALSVNLTAGEQARVWAEGTRNLDAYLKIMEGHEYLLQGNRESGAMARRMAEEAIALDPKYADAYALLGSTHMNDVWLGASRPGESIAKAIELTRKALAMNGSLADAHGRLGMLYSWSGRYDEGIAEAERGVELNPNSGLTNYFLAQVLRYAGRSKEAIPVMRKALRLEPIPPDIYVQSLALIYFQAGDCEEAVATCEKRLKRESDNLNSRAIRAAVFGFCGREEKARREAAEVLRINPKFTVESYTRILPYKYQSNKDRTIQGLRKAGLP